MSFLTPTELTEGQLKQVLRITRNHARDIPESQRKEESENYLATLYKQFPKKEVIVNSDAQRPENSI